MKKKILVIGGNSDIISYDIKFLNIMKNNIFIKKS